MDGMATLILREALADPTANPKSRVARRAWMQPRRVCVLAIVAVPGKQR